MRLDGTAAVLGLALGVGCKMNNPAFGLEGEETRGEDAAASDTKTSEEVGTLDEGESGDGDGDSGTTSSTTDDTSTAPSTTDPGDGDGDGDEWGDGDGDGDGDGGVACDSDEACDFPHELCTSEGFCEPSHQILWLNFDGGGFTYQKGATPDASTHIHGIHYELDGDFGGFMGSEVQENVILGLVTEDFYPYRVAVTAAYPGDGVDFAHVALVDAVVSGGQAIALTQVNCYDTNPRPLGFIMMTADSGYTEVMVANAIGGIAAQMLGLERSTLDGDLTFNLLQSQDAGFLDTCGTAYVEFACEHTDGGCEPGQQNTHAELAARFGLR